MSKETRYKGSTQIAFGSAGDLIVEIVRKMMQHGATTAATAMLEAIFSGDISIEDLLQKINELGLELKVTALIGLPSHVDDNGEPNTMIEICVADETITINPGMFNTIEEPDPNEQDDIGLIH